MDSPGASPPRAREAELEEQVRQLAAANLALQKHAAAGAPQPARAAAAAAVVSHRAAVGQHAAAESWGGPWTAEWDKLLQENARLRHQLQLDELSDLQSRYNDLEARYMAELARQHELEGLRNADSPRNHLTEQMKRERARAEEYERNMKRANHAKEIMSERHREEVERIQQQRKDDYEMWQDRFEEAVRAALAKGGQNIRLPRTEELMRQIMALRAKMELMEASREHDVEMEVQKRLRDRPMASLGDALMARQDAEKYTRRIRELEAMVHALQREGAEAAADRRRAFLALRMRPPPAYSDMTAVRLSEARPGAGLPPPGAGLPPLQDGGGWPTDQLQPRQV